MNRIQIYDAAGKMQGPLALDVSLTKREDNPVAYALSIRTLLQNWRQGTVGCKGRGDLAFSNRKPWKQKGTGRARVGSIRSPLWRKGGVIFGPQPRTRTLKVSGDVRKLAINNAFFSFLEAGKIYCLDYDSGISVPSAKKAAQALRGMGLADKKVVFFVDFNDIVNYNSFKNLANTCVLSFDQPNAYDITNGRCWVFLKKDVELFKQMVARWN